MMVQIEPINYSCTSLWKNNEAMISAKNMTAGCWEKYFKQKKLMLFLHVLVVTTESIDWKIGVPSVKMPHMKSEKD